MEAFVFALASLSLGVAIQRVFLVGLKSRVRAREQAYQFHALRDKLQLLAIDGRVDQASLTYTFLIQTLNLAIKNAGILKLRELLDLAEKIRQKVEQAHFEAICADIQKHDPEVRELAEAIFQAFAMMLISNDRLVSLGVKCRHYIMNSWSVLRPVLTIVDKIVRASLRVLEPIRVQAVDESRTFRNWADRLGTC